MSFLNQGNNNNLFGGAAGGVAQSTFGVQPVMQQQPIQPMFNQPALQPQQMNQQFNVYAQPQMMQPQQPVAPVFNLLGPVNQGTVDTSTEDATKAILMSVKNDIDKIIVKLLTEHQSRRENIDAIFASVNLSGVGLDILYKSGQSMCPSFSIYKQIKAGAATGLGNFGQGIGAGLTVNGVTANSGASEYTEDPNAKKMNVIISAFLNICNLLSNTPLNKSFEIRSSAANINYIAPTGMLILTPSTLILNDNKNDARKLTSKL